MADPVSSAAAVTFFKRYTLTRYLYGKLSFPRNLGRAEADNNTPPVLHVTVIPLAALVYDHGVFHRLFFSHIFIDH